MKRGFFEKRGEDIEEGEKKREFNLIYKEVWKEGVKSSRDDRSVVFCSFL